MTQPQDEKSFKPSPESEIIQEFGESLNIEWDVEFIRSPSADGPRILSLKEAKSHTIFWPPNLDVEDNKFDLVHELIHAHFAETQDPIFSSIPFAEQEQLTGSERHKLYLAQQFIDVWVGDKLRQVNPALAKQNIATLFEAFSRLKGRDFAAIDTQTLLVGFAVNFADIERGGFREFRSKSKKLRQRLSKTHGENNEAIAAKLSKLYMEAKTMSDNTEDNLAEFERIAKDAAQIMGLGIRPTIVNEPERGYIWSIRQ